MTEPKKVPLAKQLVEQFCTGKWCPAAHAAEALGATEKQIRQVLGRSKHMRGETREVGASFEFRAWRHVQGFVNIDEAIERLEPVIRQLKHEGKRRREAAAPVIVAGLAHELDHILQEWISTNKTDTE